MCGLVGFVEFGRARATQENLLAMRHRLRHRGPDDQGHWFKPGVGLAHTRLSILDLSAKAHQPMSRGNKVLVYNGEIYNFHQLRDELRNLGHQFTSDSDTEVLLCALIQWGSGALNRLDGMFAFALYDEDTHSLLLARDRSGIKPLFYYQDTERLVFASELKGLWGYPSLAKKLSLEALEDYLRLGYTSGRQTMFENCMRVLPGECLHVDVAQRQVRRETYWEGCFEPDASLDFPTSASRLKSLLSNEFKLSLVSDVPVGVCISGGVDSNVLISILAKEHGIKMRTYSLGGAGSVFDENKRAQAVAKYLGTDHRSLEFGQDQAEALLQETIAHYDEPMADQNILSLRIIARQARMDGVKVLFSGLGGDELFYGYPTVDRLAHSYPFFKLPLSLRRLFPKQWLFNSNTAYKALHLLQQNDFYGAVRGVLGNCFFDDEISQLMAQKSSFRGDYIQQVFDQQWNKTHNLTDALMRVDFKSYLTDNGFALTDVSSMAEGVEMRVPYANAPVLDLAMSIPSSVKKHGGKYKALLRHIEASYLPPELTLQGKQGFHPFLKSQWLDGPLADMVEEHLSPQYIRQQGLFNTPAVEDILRLHRNSKVNVTGKLWNLILFQLWARQNL